MRIIQKLLGHKSSKTTEIYTHITKTGMGKVISPLDNLNIEKEDYLNKKKVIAHYFWNNYSLLYVLKKWRGIYTLQVIPIDLNKE